MKNQSFKEVFNKEQFYNSKQKLFDVLDDLFSQEKVSEDEILLLLLFVSKVEQPLDLKSVNRLLSKIKSLTKEEKENLQEFSDIKIFLGFIEMKTKEVNLENWQEFLKQILTKLEGLQISECYKLIVKSWLARFLEVVCYKYIDENNDILEFKQVLDDILQEFNDIIKSALEVEGKIILGKRTPSFIESVDGTLERFSKLLELRDILQDSVEAIIVGGSLSYGPFFNIRKSLDKTGSSDIDMIIVLTEQDLQNLHENFSQLNIFEKKDIEEFLQRIEIFFKLQRNNQADLLSQKFPVKGCDFEISIHFFLPNIFEKMIGQQFEEDLDKGQDRIFVLHDYRIKPFSHKVCAQQNFLAQQFVYQVPEQKPVEQGFITELPGYIIHSQNLYPGIYQNLISPRFSVFYDREGNVQQQVEGFSKVLHREFKRLRQENSEAELLKSHIRYKIFPPILKNNI